jgi:predicted nucleotidyltransferase
VVLFGSWARGDADDDSDVDLLVVLDRVDDYGAELDRLSDLTFHHLLRSHRIVEAFPVAEEEFNRGDGSLLSSARREGVQIA